MPTTIAAWLPHSLRADFPLLRRQIDGMPIAYLDSAATSLKPQPVIDAVCYYLSHVSANIHRGKHILSEEASDTYELTRTRMGGFLDCSPHEIVFTPNTTYGINIVAAGLGLTADDLVVCAFDNHHSNLLPWRRHARVDLVRLDSGGRIDLDHYRNLLEAHPRVVAVGHCSNVTGFTAPIETMARMAHEAGALVLLDAAQSAPHCRLRVQDLGADFVVFSGHKMLAPPGIGVLRIATEHLDTLEPQIVGGGTVDRVDLQHHTWRRAPHRFEAGTPDIAAVYGLGAAIDYLERLDMTAVEAHDARMSAVLLAEAAARPWLRVVGDVHGPRRGLLSLTITGTSDISDTARILSDSYGVMCRSGHQCAQPLVDRYARGPVLRLSTYVYNTEDELRMAFAALDHICRSFGLKIA